MFGNEMRLCGQGFSDRFSASRPNGLAKTDWSNKPASYTQQKETYNYKRLLWSPCSGHYDEVGAGGREADVEGDEVSSENHSHRSNESGEEHEYDAEGDYD